MQIFQDTDDEVICHMSKNEVRELSKLQGGLTIDTNRHIPTFMPMKEALEHSIMRMALDKWSRRAYRTGGQVNIIGNLLKSSGRNGDTELVVIPRVLADVLDIGIYGGSQPGNPKTGKREYFLGNLFGGLFNSIKNGFSSLFGGGGGGGGGGGQQQDAPQAPSFMSNMMPMAGSMLSQYAPQLGQMAGQQIGKFADRFVPGMGSMFGNAAGGMLGNLGQMAGQQMQGQQSSPMNYGQMANAYKRNMDLHSQYAPMDYARSAAGSMGQAMGGMESNNPFMTGASTAMNMFGGGSSPFQSAMGGAKSAMQNSGNPYLANYGTQALNMINPSNMRSASGFASRFSPMLGNLLNKGASFLESNPEVAML